ncbi:MAG: AAA family ATPase [Chitinispirillaceae bacterium]
MAEKQKKALIFTDTDKGGIIHIANIKGGVGKSTVATNLASSLCRRGPTLLVDLDVQGSASVALGVDASQTTFCSWELFRNRFSVHALQPSRNPKKIECWSRAVESHLFGSIVGRGSLRDVVVKVKPCLDVLPASSDLFRSPRGFHYNNLLFNLRVAREFYKYIIIDTPSVWNRLTRLLYLNSDLNLIPVTLNALSTKSLREYLINVKKLVSKNPKIRLRIVKNEVYGKQSSKLVGKTRTMFENRKFLETLCEQVAVHSDSGCSLLPQSIIFDLEIPESAIVRNAQDIGQSVQEFRQYSSAAKAFEQLAKNVQYVLNSITLDNCAAVVQEERIGFASKALAALVVFALIKMNPSVPEILPPRPIAPQQVVESENNVIEHRFSNGESMYRVAKHAISSYKAIVPSYKEIDGYLRETISAHNLTRISGEPRITNVHNIPDGLVVNFYPPLNIDNPSEKQLVPVYKFFMSLVEDEHPYITGDWCERGTGGGQPHYGMDVAAPFGTKVISPIDGEAVLKTERTGGRTVGVVNDGAVIFFSHLDKRFVSTGDKVTKGMAIGTIGMTGRTSGPHIHIGYGVKSQSRYDITFGDHNYKVTDPKHFFYRLAFLQSLESQDL